MTRGYAILGPVALGFFGVGMATLWPEYPTLGWGLAVLCWVTALGWLYYLLAGVGVLAVFLRAMLALLPVASFGFGLIYLVLKYAGLDAGEEKAVIAAIVVATGWVVGFVTAELRAANQEQERRRDMIRAALTEVELIVELSRSVNWDTRIELVKDQFFKDSRYQVVVMYGHQFETLRRLTGQIEILSKHQIRPVMDFFQLLDRLERIEDKISSETFHALPPQRREVQIIRYHRMQAALAEVGDKAANALKDRPFHGWLRHLT